MADPVPGNIYDIIMGREPDAAQQAAALANMIRGGRQSQILYSLGEKNVPDALAKAYGGQAAQDQGLLEKAAMARAHYGEEARRAVLANALEKQRAHEAFVAGENDKNRNNALLLAAMKGNSNATNPEDAKSVAQAIIDGTQPPDLKYSYKHGMALRAELARKGFDFTTANQEWQAVGKNIATMNGPQQTRMRQSIYSVGHQLDNVENLYREWQKSGGGHGIKVFNRASLAASKNLPGEAGATAQALEAGINDLVEGLGNIYMGGNTPTDKAFELAKSGLSADWNPETFFKLTDLGRKNLKYRLNAIEHSVPITPGGTANRYAGGGAAEAAGGGDGTVQMKRPSDGKVGPVKKGNVEAAKKAGWTVVE